MFWSDKKAKKVLERKKFYYLDKSIPKFDNFVVKTSASLSGVLHIGRLSDTVRGESVFNSLKRSGVKSDIIWVAEDMDPLRKVPKGVPETYKKYIGMPVTDVPDPFGCHDSYAQHYVEEYFEVLDKFVSVDLKKYSMREEYKKGNFKPYVKNIMENLDNLKDIINKYRSSSVPEGWSPWIPICENCGKIITPRIRSFDGKTIKYICKDYSFEKNTAKGCNYQGEADPFKDEGKLMWKSEWAAQWARWNVVSEGAGKEYEVPNSAWWVNAEISERIFDFPMPVPIFYEYLMIEGGKMSASKGNVVYPRDWLEIAPAEVLRYLYNKKLMKTRSFSFADLPKVYDEYDFVERVYFGKEEIENNKDKEHYKRLYESSQIKVPDSLPPQVPFSYVSMLVQIYDPVKDFENIKSKLKSTGHLGSPSNLDLDYVKKRLVHAKSWVDKYAPEKSKFVVQREISAEVKQGLSEEQKRMLGKLREVLDKNWTGEGLQNRIFKFKKEFDLKPREIFQAIYLVLLGQKHGPRAGDFILALGKERMKRILDQVV